MNRVADEQAQKMVKKTEEKWDHPDQIPLKYFLMFFYIKNDF